MKTTLFNIRFLSFLAILWIASSATLFAQNTNCIGGLIFNDLNNNGLQDSVETARPDVTIVLLSAGNLLQTTISNVDGFYEFCELPNGDYTVAVLETSLQYTPLEQAVTVTASDVSGIDFAAFPYELYSSIGGVAYYDLNDNGQQDANEAGIPNLEVLLIGSDTEQAVATNEFGQFHFPFLAAGEYQVIMFSTVEIGSLTNPDFETVTIAEGEAHTGTQFIFDTPVDLGNVVGFVCYDFDEDGFNDAETESGIATVPIDIRDVDGEVVATTVTDVNGLFSFVGITEGIYTVGPSTELGDLIATTEEFSTITVFPNGVITIPIYYFPIEPIFKCGQAVVTCYSGSDSSGHVIGIKDVRDRTGAPLGSNWSPPPTYTSPQWTRTRMGEVFGIAIDNDYNIYAAATKAYGVGGFGSAGGGGIYKIDANTGAVSDFVTTGTGGIGTNQIPNSGVGLGNICYDKTNLQFFVTNFEDGKIYRIAAPGNATSAAGNILSSFDPFGDNRSANGCAPLGEILWGIGIYNNTVYFSRWNQSFNNLGVGNNQIYSIGLDAAHDFRLPSLKLEITLPDYLTNPSSPVSDISFSEDGKMLLAERGEGHCNNAWAGVHHARVLEYTGRPWVLNQLFYIGEYRAHTNAAGGVDYGYASFTVPDTPPIPDCDEFVWATGDALRLRPEAIYGLAGIPATGNGNTNSTLNSIHIDIDGNIAYSDLDKTEIGDVEVFKCGCPNDPCDKEPKTKTFSTIIDSPLDVVIPPTREICYTAYENKEGNFIVDANSNTFNSTSNIFLSGVDYAGNLIPSKQWFFTDDDPAIVYFNNPYIDTCSLGDGNLATGYQNTATGKDLFITIDDPFTNSYTACYIFKENDEADQIGYAVMQDSQAHIVAVGSTNNRDGSGDKVYAVGLDDCLNVKWIYDYTLLGNNSVAYAVTEVSGLIDPAGNVLPRLYAVTGQVDDDAFLLFIDPDTGLPTTGIYQQYDIDNGSRDVGKSIIVDKNNNLVIAGTSSVSSGLFSQVHRPFIIRYFDELNLQCRKINISGIADANGNSIAENADGNLILTGTTFDDLNSTTPEGVKAGKAYLMEIQDDLKSVLWTNTYLSAGFDRSEGKRVTITSDNGILMAGTSYLNVSDGGPNTFGNSKADVYLVKTDEDGCLDNCDCYEPRTATTYRPQHIQPNYDVLPNSHDLFEPTEICENIAVVFVQEFCDQYCPDSCLVQSDLYPIGSRNDSCCFALDLDNLDPNLGKIQIDLNTPGVFFDVASIGVGSGFNLKSYSPQSIVMDNSGNAIPVANYSQYLTFCLGNTGTLINTQSFTIAYFDTACVELVDCEQHFDMDCELPCTDDICLRIFDIKVSCDSLADNKFKFTYQVKNETNDRIFDQVDFLVINPTPIVLSPTSNPSIPPLNPGNTSGNLCIDIHDHSLGGYPKSMDIVFSASGYGINDPDLVFCCHDLKDTVTITLPDCCNPCDTTWVTADTITSMEGDCCYNLDIINTCENLLSKIKVTSLSAGVNLGYHWNPNYSSTWMFNPLTAQEVEWSPIGGGYAPTGTYTDLVHFCLDNLSGMSTPQIKVEYIYTDAMGIDSILCEDILELECEVNTKCIDILEHTVYCDSLGNYWLNFCVDNISNPYFNATELQITKLSSTPPSIGLAQSIWTGLTPSSFPLCQDVQIVGPPPMAGDVLNLEFRLKNFAADTCCIESDTLSLTLPDCCNPCDTNWVTADTITSTEGDCCYNLDIINTCENLLSKIKVTSISPGVHLGYHWNPNYTNTWAFTPLTAQEVEWSPIGGGYAPAGTYTDLVHFCLDNLSGISTPQIKVEYIYTDAMGIDSILCEDILELECEINTKCIDILEHTVYCDSLGNYWLNFCVDNISNPYFNATELQITKLSSTPPSIGLAQSIWTGLTSSSFPLCQDVQIVGPPPMAGDILNLEFRLKNFAADTCCIESDTLSLILPDCCNPCDTNWVTADTIASTEGDCCYNLDIINTCENLLSKIKVTSISPGVNLSYHSNPNYSNSWIFAPSTAQEVEWLPIGGGYAPAGTYTDLVHFCLDNLSGISNPQIKVEYIHTDATGMDSILCEDTLELECDLNANCIDITDRSLYCDSLGNYWLLFCVDNVSNPYFNATELEITKLSSTPPSIGLAQSIWTGLTPSSFPLCQDVQIVGPPPMAGDILNLAFKLKNVAADTHCTDSDTLSLILPKCEATCLHFDGNDRITVPNPVLDALGTQDFTFEAIINGGLTQTSYPIIFSNRVNNNGIVFFLHDRWSNSLYKMLCIQLGNKNYFVFDNGTYNATLLDNKCHRVSIVREADILFFYIDGNLIGTRIMSINSTAASGAPLIIGDDDITPNPFIGNIKDVRIWQTARTQSEIFANKDDLVGATTGLLANWKLDTHTGQIVTEQLNPLINNGFLGTDATIERSDPTLDPDCCSFPVSVAELEPPSFSLQVYPNPTKDYLTFDWQDRIAPDYSLQIFDIQGKLVLDKKGKASGQTLQIDLNGIVNGLYNYRLALDRQYKTGKFIKME